MKPEYSAGFSRYTSEYSFPGKNAGRTYRWPVLLRLGDRLWRPVSPERIAISRRNEIRFQECDFHYVSIYIIDGNF